MEHMTADRVRADLFLTSALKAIEMILDEEKMPQQYRSVIETGIAAGTDSDQSPAELMTMFDAAFPSDPDCVEAMTLGAHLSQSLNLDEALDVFLDAEALEEVAERYGASGYDLRTALRFIHFRGEPW